MVDHRLSVPQGKIYNSGKSVNLALFGKGSGKSHLAGCLSARFVVNFPMVDGFIAANTYDQLNSATLLKVKQVWKSMNITEWSKETPNGVYVSQVQPPPHFRIRNDYDRHVNMITFCNGVVVYTGSLDNAKSHESKEFGWAICDETKDTKEEGMRETILTRLRQRGIFEKDGVISDDPTGVPICPAYFLTSPAKVDWLNEMFELDTYIDEINASIYLENGYFEKVIKNKYVVIASTHHNLHNLSSTFIEEQQQNLSKERFNAIIYANPFSTTGGEYYSSFSRQEHVKRCSYEPEKLIHVSFDQNVVPYSPALIIQIEKLNDIWYVRCINEICLINPQNTTEHVCEEILRQYGDCQGIYFYGDASGKARKGLTKETRDHYQLIERKLAKKLFNGSNRVLKSNPFHNKRRDFVNKAFENKLPICIEIDPKCVNLLADFTYIKQDIDGTKQKDIVTDPETKEKYQKYGHMSDCFDYQIVAAFNSYYNN